MLGKFMAMAYLDSWGSLLASNEGGNTAGLRECGHRVLLSATVPDC